MVGAVYTPVSHGPREPHCFMVSNPWDPCGDLVPVLPDESGEPASVDPLNLEFGPPRKTSREAFVAYWNAINDRFEESVAAWRRSRSDMREFHERVEDARSYGLLEGWDWGK
jgi:hypothetical protein